MLRGAPGVRCHARPERARAKSSPSSCTGSGLSSSAALVCASSLAVLAVHGIRLSKGVCSLLSGASKPSPPSLPPFAVYSTHGEHRLSLHGLQAAQEVTTLAPGKPPALDGAGAGWHGAGGVGAGPGLERADRSGARLRRGGAGAEARACARGRGQARACPVPLRGCAPPRAPCGPGRARARRARCAARRGRHARAPAPGARRRRAVQGTL